MNRTNPFGGDRAWGRDRRTADIDVRAADGRLTIHAERDTERADENRRYLLHASRVSTTHG